MTGDQWFHLWMTLMQTVGGGLVTLTGAWLGFRFGARSAQRDRLQDELSYWIDELGRYNRIIIDGELTKEDPEVTTSKVGVELFGSFRSRPVVRHSIGELVSFSLFAPLAEISEKNTRAKKSESEIAKAILAVTHQALDDTIELLENWRVHGVSRKRIDKAMATRSRRLGYYRRMDLRTTGPQTNHGGWSSWPFDINERSDKKRSSDTPES